MPPHSPLPEADWSRGQRGESAVVGAEAESVVEVVLHRHVRHRAGEPLANVASGSASDASTHGFTRSATGGEWEGGLVTPPFPPPLLGPTSGVDADGGSSSAMVPCVPRPSLGQRHLAPFDFGTIVYSIQYHVSNSEQIIDVRRDSLCH